jgi:hypothetical protein
VIDGASLAKTDAVVRARYERLRQHVLGETRGADGAPGLALLMRRGVSAYIKSIEEPPTPTSTSATAVQGTQLEAGLRGELARVMVAMVLGTTTPREVNA